MRRRWLLIGGVTLGLGVCVVLFLFVIYGRVGAWVVRSKVVPRLEKKLKKPPFSSWKTFKLLRKHDKQAVKSKVLTLPLHTGSKLSLLYRDQSAAQGKKMRLRVTFTLDDKNDKRKLDSTINVDSGDHSLIGGDELPGGGTYILAVSCKAL